MTAQTFEQGTTRTAHQNASPTTTQAATTAPGASRRAGLRKRLVTLCAAVGIGVAGVALAAPTASATAASTADFYTDCNVSGVTAFSFDPGYYPNNAATWYPSLYVWTDSGWRFVANGQAQRLVGQNLLPPFSAWPEQQVLYFSRLSRGHYYQVRNNVRWEGPGIDHNWHTNSAETHEVAQGVFDPSVMKYSTAGYCYVP